MKRHTGEVHWVYLRCSNFKMSHTVIYRHVRSLWIYFATVNNGNPASGFAIVWALPLHLPDNIHALDNFAEHNMLLIQPGGKINGINTCHILNSKCSRLILPGSFSCTDEKLWSIGIGPSIGHGQDTRSSMFQLEVFISKLLPINGFASSTIMAGEVPTLILEKKRVLCNLKPCLKGLPSLKCAKIYLAHETGNDAMKYGPLVAITLLSSAQSTEILC